MNPRFFRLITFLMLIVSGYAQQVRAQSGTLLAEYSLDFKIPENVLNMEDEGLRNAYLQAFAEKSGVFTLALQGSTYGFSRDYLKDDEDRLLVEGEMAMYADFKTRELVSILVLLDESFIVADSIVNVSWEVHPNDTTRILGHLCMKATIKGFPTVAWFCPEIPAQVGPEGYFGLPGLILRLEKEAYTYTITSASVIPEVIKIEKPEGKYLTRAEFYEIQEKYLAPYKKKSKGGNVLVIEN